MIATGTDVKPLECLLFMRDVKSRNYFEQMKGRGTRTLDLDDLKKVTPSAKTAKTHYVIVDAIGVTKSLKTASQPLITKPSVPLKDLAMGVMMGARDEDTVSSLAGRLARLNKQLDDDEQRRIRKPPGAGAHATGEQLFDAIDADNIEASALELARHPIGAEPGDAKRAAGARATGGRSGQGAQRRTDRTSSTASAATRNRPSTTTTSMPCCAPNGTRTPPDNAQALTDEFAEYLEEPTATTSRRSPSSSTSRSAGAK